MSPLELSAPVPTSPGVVKNSINLKNRRFSPNSRNILNPPPFRKNPDYDELMTLIDSDLNEAYPKAFDEAEKAGDRGAKERSSGAKEQPKY